MTDTSKQKATRDRAESSFKKTARQQHKSEATTEYQTAAQAIGDKTARLKTLRLAKEAADEKSAPKKKLAAPRKKLSV